MFGCIIASLRNVYNNIEIKQIKGRQLLKLSRDNAWQNVSVSR